VKLVACWVSSVAPDTTEMACGMSIRVCSRFCAVTTISSMIDAFCLDSSAAKAGAWASSVPTALEISRAARLIFIPFPLVEAPPPALESARMFPCSTPVIT
jgi:hypothetical protein